MKNKRLNCYFFGDTGNYDYYNPSYVFNKEYVPEILYIIASNEPFSISKYDITKNLCISEEYFDDCINNLNRIDAIEIENNTYRIKFPVFLEDDVVKIEKCVGDLGKVIGDKIISLKDMLISKLSELECSKHYSKERILYHIICNDIFDGTAFDFFGERDIFCVSKVQPGNRDYIIFGYEDSSEVESHSNNLLCSSNNYISSGFTFNSFGDSNGSRKDMYRFLRLVQKSLISASPFESLNISYISVLEDMNKEIMKNCGELICHIIRNNVKYMQLTDKERNLTSFLKELEYLDVDECNSSITVKVPVFYTDEKTITDNLSDIILLNIFPIVKEFFENLDINLSDITAIRHMVSIKETANELWHQVFGAVNEYLVKKEFVSLPCKIDGQGRYLRSIEINKL